MKHLSGLLVAACLLFVGCQDSPLDTNEAVPAESFETELDEGLLGKLGSGPAARGQTRTTIEGGTQHFAFHVRERQGEARGVFVLNSRGQDVRMVGRLDCLRIVDNRAIVSGYIAKVNSDNPYGIQAGWIVFFGVEDNGRRRRGEPDQWTDVFVLEAGASCSIEITDRWWQEIENGDFDVVQ